MALLPSIFDYGLDMLAAYIIAVDTFNSIYVIHEIHRANLIISDAAKKMLDVPLADLPHIRTSRSVG